MLGFAGSRALPSAPIATYASIRTVGLCKLHPLLGYRRLIGPGNAAQIVVGIGWDGKKLVAIRRELVGLDLPVPVLPLGAAVTRAGHVEHGARRSRPRTPSADPAGRVPVR